MLLLLTGPLSICVDGNQIFKQKVVTVMLSDIEPPSRWPSVGSVMVTASSVCVSVVFGIPVLCQFGFILLCCCTSGSPL